ncbi:MAG: hypothetical protein IJ615_03490 [Bacteroidaceae bacterium]|nr:hypothetical protein [Bacteroidaceae bacterium]
METTLGKSTALPVSHYWGMIKDLDDSQKLELVTMLVNSVKPSVAEDKETTHSPKPYTVEELHQMIAEGELQFAKGQWQDSEEMFRELEQEMPANV